MPPTSWVPENPNDRTPERLIAIGREMTEQIEIAEQLIDWVIDRLHEHLCAEISYAIEMVNDVDDRIYRSVSARLGRVDERISKIVDQIESTVWSATETAEASVSPWLELLTSDESGDDGASSGKGVPAEIDGKEKPTVGDDGSSGMLPQPSSVVPISVPQPPPPPPPPPPSGTPPCTLQDGVDAVSSQGVPQRQFSGIGVYNGAQVRVYNGCCTKSGVAKECLSARDMVAVSPTPSGEELYWYWYSGPDIVSPGPNTPYGRWLASLDDLFPSGTCGGSGDDTTPVDGGDDTVGCCPPPPCCDPDPINPKTDKDGADENCCFPCPKVAEEDIRNVRVLPWGKKQGKEAWMLSECGWRELSEAAAKASPASFLAGLIDSERWSENLEGEGGSKDGAESDEYRKMNGKLANCVNDICTPIK